MDDGDDVSLYLITNAVYAIRPIRERGLETTLTLPGHN